MSVMSRRGASVVHVATLLSIVLVVLVYNRHVQHTENECLSSRSTTKQSLVPLNLRESTQADDRPVLFENQNAAPWIRNYFRDAL